MKKAPVKESSARRQLEEIYGQIAKLNRRRVRMSADNPERPGVDAEINRLEAAVAELKPALAQERAVESEARRQFFADKDRVRELRNAIAQQESAVRDKERQLQKDEKRHYVRRRQVERQLATIEEGEKYLAGLRDELAAEKQRLAALRDELEELTGKAVTVNDL